MGDRVILPSVFGSKSDGVQPHIPKKSHLTNLWHFVEHRGDSIWSLLSQTSLPSNQPKDHHLLPTVLRENRRMNRLFSRIILKGIYPPTGHPSEKIKPRALYLAPLKCCGAISKKQEQQWEVRCLILFPRVILISFTKLQLQITSLQKLNTKQLHVLCTF